MKKILIFTHEFPPRLGGAGGVALQLANYLNNTKYDVTVVTSKRKHSSQYNFKLIEIYTFSKLWFLNYFLFFKLHNLKQYDYIIINDGGAIYSAGLSFHKEALQKSIVYVHGVEKYLKQDKLFLKLMNFKSIYLKVFEKSKKIITVSDFIKDLFFQNELKQFLKKVETIYNGVDTKCFHYVDNNILSKYELSVNATILLSVSRLTKDKGYLTKLKFFEKLLKINKNYIWFIIGDGSFKIEFDKIIKTKKLDRNIILLGKKNKEELKYFYSKADFFWLLSDLEESFGLVYLEAMACKCIPIGWNKAGVKEVIQNGINGCLANSEDEVIEFIRSGYKQIDRENLSNNVIRIEDNYDKVLL